MGLADFMLGKASSFQQGNAALSNTRQNSVGLYIQDTWKATSRLTTNAGLRFEPHLAPYGLDRVKHFENEWFDKGLKSKVFTNAPAGIMFSGDDLIPEHKMGYDSWLHFAPRVGFAWDLNGDGRTTLRAAYGLLLRPAPNVSLGG